MRAELLKRNAIQAALDAIIVGREAADGWNSLTEEERQQAIVTVEYWTPDVANENLISRSNIGDSVHIFLEWGDIDSYTNTHPNSQHTKANYTFNIHLITANTKDPQGNLLVAEETVFDKMKTITNVTYNSLGGRWATNEDRSVCILTMNFTYANVKVNT